MSANRHKWSEWITDENAFKKCPVCTGDNHRSLGVQIDNYTEHVEDFYCLTCKMTWTARIQTKGADFIQHVRYQLYRRDEAQANIQNKGED